MSVYGGIATSWREIAAWTIDEALIDAERQGLDAAATLKLIDSRYPFGPRENHPYQVWLSERRRVVQHLGLRKDDTKFRCKFCRDKGCLACGVPA